MSKAEYYAGFFDGGGSIGIYRNGSGVWHLRTQLTQNVGPAARDLLVELRGLYGGNLSLLQEGSVRKRAAFNWQLNSATAAAFLREIRPFLRLRAEQADVAMAWHEVAQQPRRGDDGRMLPYERNRAVDIAAAQRLKAMKKG